MKNDNEYKNKKNLADDSSVKVKLMQLVVLVVFSGYSLGLVPLLEPVWGWGW